MMGSRKPERDELIVARVGRGDTRRSVGGDFGISGERVRQIVNRARGAPHTSYAAMRDKLGFELWATQKHISVHVTELRIKWDALSDATRFEWWLHARKKMADR